MRTFFIDLKRHNDTPVVVEYSFRGGSPTTYSSLTGADGGEGPEVEIVRAWLKADENDPNCPDIVPTDAECETWVNTICERHVDEVDEDDW